MAYHRLTEFPEIPDSWKGVRRRQVERELIESLMVGVTGSDDRIRPRQRLTHHAVHGYLSLRPNMILR